MATKKECNPFCPFLLISLVYHHGYQTRCMASNGEFLGYIPGLGGKKNYPDTASVEFMECVNSQEKGSTDLNHELADDGLVDSIDCMAPKEKLKDEEFFDFI